MHMQCLRGHLRLALRVRTSFHFAVALIRVLIGSGSIDGSMYNHFHYVYAPDKQNGQKLSIHTSSESDVASSSSSSSVALSSSVRSCVLLLLGTVVCWYGNDVCTNLTYTFVYKTNVCTYLLVRFRAFGISRHTRITVNVFIVVLLWVRKGSVYKHDVHICVRTQCVYKPDQHNCVQKQSVYIQPSLPPPTLQRPRLPGLRSLPYHLDSSGSSAGCSVGKERKCVQT
jgi:hypothetical protein